jgi:hypothetical protein
MPRYFIATLCYELSADTPPDARRLLRAELVGRRWQDRFEEQRMPAGAVWIRRSAEDHQTVDDVQAACAADLREAVARVAATGRKITVGRAWLQVSGAGSYGLVPLGP